mmetsp:Transcript_18151/g.44884  ORF Transcript_18151/g.44884 Transcript_18151/m.44884 type:complete len:108 (+) Transcript_18151:381-704(+)
MLSSGPAAKALKGFDKSKCEIDSVKAYSKLYAAATNWTSFGLTWWHSLHMSVLHHPQPRGLETLLRSAPNRNRIERNWNLQDSKNFRFPCIDRTILGLPPELWNIIF